VRYARRRCEFCEVGVACVVCVAALAGGVLDCESVAVCNAASSHTRKLTHMLEGAAAALPWLDRFRMSICNLQSRTVENW
jgi:hypothetical protein